MTAEIILLPVRRATAPVPRREPLFDPDVPCVGCGRAPAAFDRITRAWWCAGCTALNGGAAA